MFLSNAIVKYKFAKVVFDGPIYIQIFKNRTTSFFYSRARARVRSYRIRHPGSLSISGIRGSFSFRLSIRSRISPSLPGIDQCTGPILGSSSLAMLLIDTPRGARVRPDARTHNNYIGKQDRHQGDRRSRFPSSIA